MARRSFDQAVSRIRQLAENEGMTAFEMGDEALDQCPMAQPNMRNASEVKLAELAEASGVPFTTLENRRFVSSRVTPAFRNAGVPWQVYANVARVGDATKRQDLLVRLLSFDFTAEPTLIVNGALRTKRWWTIDAIMSHLGETPPNPQLGSDALLKRAFREASPEQIIDALEQPEIRRAVYQGLHEREQHVAERTERIAEADPVSRQFDQQQAMLDLQKWVDVLRRHIAQLHGDILPRLGRAPDRDPLAMRRFLAEALADLDEATAPVRTFVDSGTTDIDRFLSEVLNRG